MVWTDRLNADPLPWLLEESDPGVRYLVLRDLLELSPDDPHLLQARCEAHTWGPLAEILAQMKPGGWWEKKGPGYNPKYRSTDWTMVLMAQLGASREEDERVGQACEYVLQNSLSSGGRFSINGTPSGTIDCLQGNLCWALAALGSWDERLERAYDWLARSVTGEGIAPKEEKRAAVRYSAYKCGPNFACGANYGAPCAWGAVKVMLALAALPQEHRTALHEQAIQQGVDFLLGTDPARAEYPSPGAGKPNRSWFKFGFPVFYVTDVLQITEALASLDSAGDPRLANALELVRSKQDGQGRWALEYDYAGKTWGDYGVKKQPNKWVTLRALRVLKAAGNQF